MKNISFLLLCLLSFKNCAAQFDLSEVKRFGTNPGNLKMFFHSTSKVNNETEKIPMVVVLHGCSQSAEIVARESGWNKLADEYGFHVLYPQQSILNNASRCFNWFYSYDFSKDMGEAFSIREMISFAVKHFIVDTNRVFIYGLSAGAEMAVSLMADYPEVFYAGASLAGGPCMVADNFIEAFNLMSNGTPKNAIELGELIKRQNRFYNGAYPKLVVIHGENDWVVNYKNANSLINQWSTIHKIDSIATTEIKQFKSNDDVKRYSWNDSLNNERIIFYSIKNLGHALPVSPGNGKEEGGEVGIFSANKYFFSTYYIALDFGLIPR